MCPHSSEPAFHYLLGMCRWACHLGSVYPLVLLLPLVGIIAGRDPDLQTPAPCRADGRSYAIDARGRTT